MGKSLSFGTDLEVVWIQYDAQIPAFIGAPAVDPGFTVAMPDPWTGMMETVVIAQRKQGPLWLDGFEEGGAGGGFAAVVRSDEDIGAQLVGYMVEQRTFGAFFNVGGQQNMALAAIKA